MRPIRIVCGAPTTVKNKARRRRTPYNSRRNFGDQIASEPGELFSRILDRLTGSKFELFFVLLALYFYHTGQHIKMATEEHKQLADLIKNAHATLREESRNYGTEAAWERHVAKKDVLQKYSTSMHKLATTFWSNHNVDAKNGTHCRMEWIKSQCKDYFFHGGKEKYCDRELSILEKINEYLPCPKQRFICCKKAYDLLKNGGVLIVISPDSKHVGANAKFMKSWRYVLSKLGFMRIKYEKMRHIHCMMYRKCTVKEVALRWAELQDLPKDDPLYQVEDKIYIPQDFQKTDKEIDEREKIHFTVEDVLSTFNELPFDTSHDQCDQKNDVQSSLLILCIVYGIASILSAILRVPFLSAVVVSARECPTCRRI
ncbi:hypothetical protein KM043_010842 [Ampulex compressa]|nr:hypothetical protein KM043_010842 [Ampulex compressa]